MSPTAPLITAPVETLDQLTALPVGAVIRDRDQDKAVRVSDGRWKYNMPHGRAPLLLPSERVFRYLGPIYLVAVPRTAEEAS